MLLGQGLQQSHHPAVVAPLDRLAGGRQGWGEPVFRRLVVGVDHAGQSRVPDGSGPGVGRAAHHHGPDPRIGKHFEQKGMGLATIDDVGGRHPLG